METQTRLPPPAKAENPERWVSTQRGPDGSLKIKYWDLPTGERLKMALWAGFFVALFSATIVFLARWIAMAFSETVPETLWSVLFAACTFLIFQRTKSRPKEIIIKHDGIVFGTKGQHQIAFKDVAVWTSRGDKRYFITAGIPSLGPTPQVVPVADGPAAAMQVVHSEIKAAWSKFCTENGIIHHTT